MEAREVESREMLDMITAIDIDEDEEEEEDTLMEMFKRN